MEVMANGGSGLCGPAFSSDGKLLVCSQGSGEICTVEGGQITPILSCGAPAGLCSEDGALYICDMAFQGVLRHAEGDLSELVKEYEAKPFKGPSSIAIDASGNIYFLDCGPLGETTLADAKGSALVASMYSWG